MARLVPLAASLLALCPALLLADPAAAQELRSAERAAGLLQQATITLRIAGELAEPAAAAHGPEHGHEAVAVVSGVSLGGGWIVTFASPQPAARIRATLPDGQQAEARLAVLDQFSGLALLRVAPDLPGIALAKELPPVGSPLLTAAAAGIEPPAISLGILGAHERTLAGAGLPPLLECDLRTTAASSGAAVVNERGELAGIVAAMPAGGEAGWTYALPVEHVRRLLQARVEGSLVVLRRQRPSVGLTLGPGDEEGVVRVDRVAAGGPAEQAGIRPGDVVLEADGRKVRSAYQAVSLVLRKQPGDTLDLLVLQEGRQLTFTVTLTAAAMPLGPLAAGDARIGPQVEARSTGRNQFEVRNGGRVAELAVEPDPEEEAPRLPRDELTLLRTQLAAFARVIERLQDELARRDEAQMLTNELIQSLTDQIAELRQELADKRDGE